MPTDTKAHRILRLILFLSNSYRKTKEDCITFLEIGDTAFYSYCNTLKDTGFNLHQKVGKYWIDYSDQDFQVLRNVLHFSEEEMYLLSRSIDMIEEKPVCSTRLKQKLASFLNQDKTIETYIRKEKSAIVQSLRKAQQQKKQIMLINYASGNSQTVKNRLVEPFEFNDVMKDSLSDGQIVRLGELGSLRVSIGSDDKDTAKEVTSSSISSARVIFTLGKDIKDMLLTLTYEKVATQSIPEPPL